MTMTQNELIRIIEGVLVGDVTDEDHLRLLRAVEKSPQLTRTYLEYMHLHVHLCHGFGTGTTTQEIRRRTVDGAIAKRLKSGDEVAPLTVSVAGAADKVQRQRNRIWTATVALLASALVWLLFMGDPATRFSPVDGPQTAMAAKLTRLAGVARSDNAALAQGASLGPGSLQIEAGLAEVTFDCGARLVLEAPALLEVVDDSRGFLRAGSLVAHTSSAKMAFVLDSPQAELRHLGTEFGVRVTENGPLLTQVFEGEVVAKLKGGMHRSQVVAQGEALRLSSQPEGQRIEPHPFVAERFIRELPDQAEYAFSVLPPRNRGAIEAVQVVQAKQPPVIDGELSDWGDAIPFSTACEPPFDEGYFLHGKLMFDADHLYVGMQVGDPAPMRNAIAEEDFATLGWKGGSVQLRLALDRSLPWPLDAISHRDDVAKELGLGYRPQDQTDRIVHLTMFYHRPTDRPRLVMQYGIDCHAADTTPSGWQGVIRADDAGAGYTLEYAIPWSLLNVGNDPPRVGDQFAASLMPHWSAPDGRLWRGHLVDIVNPSASLTELKLSPQRTISWGRVLFTGNLPE